MRRRDFLASFVVTPSVGEARHDGMIMTVLGPRRPSEMGLMLPHEHIMSTFGSDATDLPEYDRDRLLRVVVPYLESVRRRGCGSLADCTAARFGRDPGLLASISKKTGILVLTNTGYYGAAEDRYVPPLASLETAEQIADHWTKEWQNGIGTTGIRPGFIKVGVDEGPLSEIDGKLIRAAARTHLASGLTIAVHTGANAGAAREQLALLREAGVSPEAWIWVHAQAAPGGELLWAAGQGAWLSFDGISVSSVDRHLELVDTMKRAGFLDHVLLSHDGDAFPVNGAPRPLDALFTTFIPRLRQIGFTSGEIDQLTRGNPQRALTIRVRATGVLSSWERSRVCSSSRSPSPPWRWLS